MEHIFDFIKAQKELKDCDRDIEEIRERIKNLVAFQKSIKNIGMNTNHLNLLQTNKVLAKDIKLIIPSMEDIDLAESIGSSVIDTEIFEEGLSEGLKALRAKLAESLKKKKEALINFISKFKFSKKSKEERIKELLIKSKKFLNSIKPEKIEEFENRNYDGYSFSFIKEKEIWADKVIQALYHLEKKNSNDYIWLDLNQLNPLLSKSPTKLDKWEIRIDHDKELNGIPSFELLTPYDTGSTSMEDDPDFKEDITHGEGGWTIENGKRNIDSMIKLVDRLITDKVETKFFGPLAEKISENWNEWAMVNSEDNPEWDIKSEEVDACHRTLRVAADVYMWMFKEFIHCLQHFYNVYK